MNKTLEELNKKYGFDYSKIETKKLLEEHCLHPVYKKWLTATWEIQQVYGFVESEQISLGKARELVAAIIEAQIKPLPEQPVDYVQKGNVIPYQCCPVCQGFGKVLADGFTSSVYKQCEVCNGAKVIPMCLIPIISEQQAVAQSSGCVVKLPELDNTLDCHEKYREGYERAIDSTRKINPTINFAQ